MDKCSSCGSTNVQTDSENKAITSWERDQDGSIVAKPGRFTPVKLKYCQSCGHVDLYVDFTAI